MSTFGYVTEDGSTVVDFEAGIAEDFTGLPPDLVSVGTRPVSQRDLDAKALRDQAQLDAQAEDTRAAELNAALTSLTDPLIPRTVTGSTVSAVKASADAAIKDIAAQTEARLAAIADVLGG
jgi:hypothetical protein